MSRNPCGYNSESAPWDHTEFSVFDRCEYSLDGPFCPHPKACNKEGRCLHPVVENEQAVEFSDSKKASP